MLFVKTDHRKRPGGSAEPAASWLETRDVDSEATWRTVRLGRRDCRSPRRGASGDLLVRNNSREVLRKVPDEIARVILSTEDERRLSPP
jgi:hypothetical protein